MKSCINKRYENEFVNLMISKGYHCERVAGSGSGKNAVCDCILFKEGDVFLVEVKATKEKKFYLRQAQRQQLQKMYDISKKYCVKSLLALKFKRKGWKLFSQPLDNITKLTYTGDEQ